MNATFLLPFLIKNSHNLYHDETLLNMFEVGSNQKSAGVLVFTWSL